MTGLVPGNAPGESQPVTSPEKGRERRMKIEKTTYRDNISANSARWKLFVLTEEGELKKLDLRLAANRRIKKTILEERRKRKKEV